MTFSLHDLRWEYWSKRSHNVCGVDTYINVHPKLNPQLLGWPGKNLALHQEIGLVFLKQQLRFVSCHREQKHWIGQFKKLVSVFDIPTWLLILMSCFTVSYFVKVMNPFRERKIKSLRFYWD